MTLNSRIFQKHSSLKIPDRQFIIHCIFYISFRGVIRTWWHVCYVTKWENSIWLNLPSFVGCGAWKCGQSYILMKIQTKLNQWMFLVSKCSYFISSICVENEHYLSVITLARNELERFFSPFKIPCNFIRRLMH